LFPGIVALKVTQQQLKLFFSPVHKLNTPQHIRVQFRYLWESPPSHQHVTNCPLRHSAHASRSFVKHLHTNLIGTKLRASFKVHHLLYIEHAY